MTYPSRLFLVMIISCIIFTYQANAQDGTIASVAAGVSIPNGDFANTDFSDPASGFAQVGFNLNLLFGYKFNDYVGLGALITGNVHQFDYSAFRDGLREEYGQEFPNVDELYVNTRQWGSGGIVAGALFSLPVNTRFAFEFKVMAGFLYVYSPELKITYESQAQPGYIIFDSDRAFAFAWDLGAGIRYNMRASKYVILQFDYLGSQPYFKDQKTYYSFKDDESNSFKQDMRMMNITIGLGYYIN